MKIVIKKILNILCALLVIAGLVFTLAGVFLKLGISEEVKKVRVMSDDEYEVNYAYANRWIDLSEWMKYKGYKIPDFGFESSIDLHKYIKKYEDKDDFEVFYEEYLYDEFHPVLIIVGGVMCIIGGIFGVIKTKGYEDEYWNDKDEETSENADVKTNTSDKLEELKGMLDKKLITQKEYDNKKQELLNKM